MPFDGQFADGEICCHDEFHFGVGRLVGLGRRHDMILPVLGAVAEFAEVALEVEAAHEEG